MLMKKDYSDSLAAPHNDKQREVYIKFRSLAEWLAMHSSENVSMDEAANHVGYSKFHFARLFKEYTGMTFNDYQTTLKLKEVERQLSDTDLQISDIAMSCGFNNLTSLSRSFKKQYGCSPSQFRNRIRRSKKRSYRQINWAASIEETALVLCLKILSFDCAQTHTFDNIF